MSREKGKIIVIRVSRKKEGGETTEKRSRKKRGGEIDASSSYSG